MIHNLSENEIQHGLLAFLPFLLVTSSLYLGFSIGLITVILLLLLASLFYLLRSLIPVQQRLAVVLVISVSVMLIARMLIHAEAFSIADKIGLFLPLLVMNSLVLSVNETIFTKQDFKSAISHVFRIGTAILLLFVIYGSLRELVSTFSFFTSSAGCFFLSGFLFTVINISKTCKCNH